MVFTFFGLHFFFFFFDGIKRKLWDLYVSELFHVDVYAIVSPLRMIKLLYAFLLSFSFLVSSFFFRISVSLSHYDQTSQEVFFLSFSSIFIPSLVCYHTRLNMTKLLKEIFFLPLFPLPLSPIVCIIHGSA